MFIKSGRFYYFTFNIEYKYCLVKIPGILKFVRGNYILNWQELMGWKRVIVHVDMDAFFAAIEQRDNPSLRAKPVIVGALPRSRGVVSTASYEARAYGVRSAMPISRAWHLCPEGVFLPVNMEKYVRVSCQLMDILQEFTSRVEQVSIDEAFLDVTGYGSNFQDPVDLARALKQRIKDQLQLPVSVGVGPNKFIAKLASGMKKPDGLVVIPREEVEKVLSDLPVAELWGVGKSLEAKLKEMGINTVGELALVPREILRQKFGKIGEFLHEISHGIDEREVETEYYPKSFGREITFEKDTREPEIISATLRELSREVSRRLQAEGYLGKVVNLKIRYANFETHTRSFSLLDATDLEEIIYYTVCYLLVSSLEYRRKIRLLGVSVAGLISAREGQQLLLFPEGERKEHLVRAQELLRQWVRSNVSSVTKG